MASAWLHADWPAPPTVRAFTTLRHGLGESVAPFDHFNLGNRQLPDGDDPEVVARNRQQLIEHARLPSAPHWLRQVHGTRVCRFDWSGGNAAEAGSQQAGPQQAASKPDAGLELQADAAVSATPGSVLAILTADCLPVLLCAGDAGPVGAAHAGWRGLAAGVLENTVAAMDASPERMLAWLGPAAGPQNYEVGVEVYDAFVASDWSAGSAFVSTRPHHWRVDLYALARRRLAAAGLRPENIHGGGLCTIADPQRFYSHRRDRRTGRMASLIWIDVDRG